MHDIKNRVDTANANPPSPNVNAEAALSNPKVAKNVTAVKRGTAHRRNL